MFFILSKTLSYLVRPLVLIVMVIAIGWVTKNPTWKRRLYVLSILLLLFFSNEFIANEAVNAWEIKATPFSEIQRDYAYGILLSGAAKKEVGPEDRVYIGSGADRINHTMQLYKMGRIRKILVSGGSGRLVDIGEREADDLAALLQLMGIPPEDILIENTSRNTHESAMKVKEMLEGKTKPEDCLLITSAFHMRRSMACFAKAGWPAQAFSTDFLGHHRKYSFDILFVPKLEAILWWQILSKEGFGFVAYWLAGYI